MATVAHGCDGCCDVRKWGGVSLVMSGSGLQCHDASLPPCVAATWSLLVMAKGAMSCRFEARDGAAIDGECVPRYDMPVHSHTAVRAERVSGHIANAAQSRC